MQATQWRQSPVDVLVTTARCNRVIICHGFRLYHVTAQN